MDFTNLEFPSDNEEDSSGFSMTITLIFGSQAQSSPAHLPTQYTRRNLRPLEHRRAASMTGSFISSSNLEALSRIAPILLLNFIFGLGGESQQGQPSASDASISSLQVIPQLSEKRWLKHRSCAICLEEFPKGFLNSRLPPSLPDESIVRLPCHHLYHKKCIHQWLKMSCTCPSCRYELLTENEDYNVGIRERMAIRDLELGADTDEEEDRNQAQSHSRKRKPSEEPIQESESKRQKF